MSVRPYTSHPSAAFPFFVYDPMGAGLMYFRTEAERDAKAKEVIEEYCEDGEWSPEVENIVCGAVTHIATEVDREEPVGNIDEDGLDENGIYWPPDCEWRCRYEMRPPQQPHGGGGE